MLPSAQDFNAQIIEGFITAHLAGTVAGLPVYVHTIEHADGVVLVDTGMLDSTLELDKECEPVPMPENIPRDVVRVIKTHTSTTAAATACFPVCRSTSSGSELQAPHDPHEWVDFPRPSRPPCGGRAGLARGQRAIA